MSEVACVQNTLMFHLCSCAPLLPTSSCSNLVVDVKDDEVLHPSSDTAHAARADRFRVVSDPSIVAHVAVCTIT